MGKRGCCSENIGLQKGQWSAEEDELLTNYIQAHGEGNWKSLPDKAGLLRCGKSCRLRWMNYLRPNIKRGNITPDEVDIIIKMHALLGNRWSLIARRLPGRTDNEIKNYWNTRLSKKLRVVRGKNDRNRSSISISNTPTTTNNNNKGGGGGNHRSNYRVKDEKFCFQKNIVECESTEIFTPKPIRVTSSSLTSHFSLKSDVFDTGNHSTACCSNSDDDGGKNCKLINEAACIDGNNSSNGLGIDEEYLDRDHRRQKTLDMVYEEYLQLLKTER